MFSQPNFTFKYFLCFLTNFVKYKATSENVLALLTRSFVNQVYYFSNFSLAGGWYTPLLPFSNKMWIATGISFIVSCLAFFIIAVESSLYVFIHLKLLYCKIIFYLLQFLRKKRQYLERIGKFIFYYFISFATAANNFF